MLDGVCRSCLHPYRFGSGLRVVAAASVAGFGLSCALGWLAFRECSACVRLEVEPLFAFVPIVLLLAAIAGIFAAGTLGVRLYLLRLRRSGAEGTAVQAVDERDLPSRADIFRTRPATAVGAALVLLSLLVWTLVGQLQTLDEQFKAGGIDIGKTAEAAGVVPMGSPAVLWFFVGVEALAIVLVFVCLAAFVRRLARNARTRDAAH